MHTKSILTAAAIALVAGLASAPANAHIGWHPSVHFGTNSEFTRGRMDIDPFGVISQSNNVSVVADGNGSVSMEVYHADDLIGDLTAVMSNQDGDGVDLLQVLKVIFVPGTGPGPATCSVLGNQMTCLLYAVMTDPFFDTSLRADVVVSLRGNIDEAQVFTGGTVFGTGYAEMTVKYTATYFPCGHGGCGPAP